MKPASVTTDVESSETGYSVWPVVAVFAAWLGLFAVAKYACQPPLPVKANAPNNQFSAERATDFLQNLVGDGIPHPAGSKQNQIVGNRIKETLEAFGYQVYEQHATRKIRFRRSSAPTDTIALRNLYAIKPGDPNLGAVMLVSHYDSVSFGPGASDDGVAVAAILEIARMSVTELPPGRKVIFLFTDGEEYGLLGADAFVKENPLAAEVEFVINLEARGTSGPSLMFQTSSDSSQIISIFSKSVRRPITSSLFESIYRRLPNDTDFTVFREQGGSRGLNFAFIGDARNYHTPNDNFENVNLGSLQHHGENAWGVLKTLTSLPDSPPNRQRSVYFDWFGRWLVIVDASLAKNIGVASAVLFFAALFYICSRQSLWWPLLKSFAVLALSSVAIVVWLSLIDASFRWQDRFGLRWVDHPEVVELAFWAMAIAVSTFVMSVFRLNPTTIWLACWSVWAVMTGVTSVWLVGASYLFTIPFVFALACVFLNFLTSSAIPNLLSAIGCGVFWIPIGNLLYDALGYGSSSVLIARIVLVNLTFLALLSGCRRESQQMCAWASFGIGFVATIVALTLNPSV